MQINRFNRSDFYKRVLVDGQEEFDLTSNSINDFKFSREMTYYKITSEDIGRPDLIAVKSYDDISKIGCWWIIMFVNNILDCQNDIYEGQILNVPHPQDLNDLLTFNSSQK